MADITAEHTSHRQMVSGGSEKVPVSIGSALRRWRLVALTLLFSTTLEASSWQTFTSTAGRFSILMPGNPQLHQHIHQSFVGAIQENTYSTATSDGDYSAEYSDLPWVAVSLSGAGTIFRRAKEGVLRDNGGAETSFDSIALGKHPGKELSFHIPGKESGKAHFFLVEQRLYVLVATSSDPGNVQRFLNSFRLLDGQRANTEPLRTRKPR
jgi:hypothetical protein